MRTTLAVAATVVLAGMGAVLVVWEAIEGPSVDGAGVTQDDGGYLLGLPLLLVAAIAVALLVAGNRSGDGAVRGDREVQALCVLALPVLALVLATATGLLDVTLLWDGR